jgi:hypothetical protein
MAAKVAYRKRFKFNLHEHLYNLCQATFVLKPHKTNEQGLAGLIDPRTFFARQWPRHAI